MKTKELAGARTFAATLKDLADTFDNWGVAKADWTIKKNPLGPGVELTYYLPYDPTPHHVVSLRAKHQSDLPTRQPSPSDLSLHTEK